MNSFWKSVVVAVALAAGLTLVFLPVIPAEAAAKCDTRSIELQVRFPNVVAQYATLASGGDLRFELDAQALAPEGKPLAIDIDVIVSLYSWTTGISSFSAGQERIALRNGNWHDVRQFLLAVPEGTFWVQLSALAHPAAGCGGEDQRGWHLLGSGWGEI